MKEIFREIKSRLFLPVALLICTWLLGTFGYMLLGRGKWSFIDCAFMTAITLSGVGYGDILGVEGHPSAVFFTMFIIILGLGIVLYCLSTITAFIVEGGINLIFKERKMLNKIAKLENHYIVCGAGGTGMHIVKEMSDVGANFVVIESSLETIEKMETDFSNILYVVGDSTEDESLIKAGIKNAKGIVACLSNDKDNLYITVTAKNLNPSIMVVARAIAVEMKDKLLRVGADKVVSPNQIGGMRMASEILRPKVVTFLDKMLRPGSGHSTRVGEVTIEKGSRLDGVELRNSNIKEETGMVVIAVEKAGSAEITYNPKAGYFLNAGDTIIIIGTIEDIANLEKIAH